MENAEKIKQLCEEKGLICRISERNFIYVYEVDKTALHGLNLIGYTFPGIQEEKRLLLFPENLIKKINERKN